MTDIDYAEYMRLRARLAQLEEQVAFLMRHLNVEYVPPKTDERFADVEKLAQQGKMIEAIRLYRDRTGVSLEEAKAFCIKLVK